MISRLFTNKIRSKLLLGTLFTGYSFAIYSFLNSNDSSNYKISGFRDDVVSDYITSNPDYIEINDK